MTLATWHFIRHVPPLPEALEIAYGHGDVAVDHDSPRAKARLLEIANDLPVNAQWHVSPTPRTRVTADGLIAARPELAPHSNEIDPGFLEQNFGMMADIPFKTLREREDYKAYMADPLNVCPDKGESFVQCFNRVGARIDQLSVHPATRVVVAHGGVLRAAIAHLLQFPLGKIIPGFDILPLTHIAIVVQAQQNGMGVKNRLARMTQGYDLKPAA